MLDVKVSMGGGALSGILLEIAGVLYEGKRAIPGAVRRASSVSLCVPAVRIDFIVAYELATCRQFLRALLFPWQPSHNHTNRRSQKLS